MTLNLFCSFLKNVTSTIRYKILPIYILFMNIGHLFHFYIIFRPSNGTLNGAPCQGQHTPSHAKDPILDFDEE